MAEGVHPVIVVGAGPVGLALSIDLALRGVPVTVLDEGATVATGSRAICWSKRTLEIFDRLGVGAACLAEGVTWKTGRVFHREAEVFRFDLLPEDGHRMPAFVNLAQSRVEDLLVARALAVGVDLRWHHRVAGVATAEDGADLAVESPGGPLRLRADWVVACDGARSALRRMLGLGFAGRVFEDNFLIADVAMAAAFPAERRFWFQPVFRSGDSALLHRQPGGVWRIDFQLGRNIDRAAELAPERVRARVAAMLGPGVAFDLVWTSVYTFQCRRMDRFRRGRVVFAGDAAHQVSPFGARGANSGVQDADNLGWKLALVLRGEAPESLLDSYEAERIAAADENILQSTRATDFISPASPLSRLFRDAVLALAATQPFARPLVNSGRLSVPCVLDTSPLNGPDAAGMPARSRPGSACPDAPVPGGWLLDRLGGGFVLLAIGAAAPDRVAAHGQEVPRLALAPTPELRARYLGTAAAAVYLIRPDQHVAARWAAFDAGAVAGALARAIGKDP